MKKSEGGTFLNKRYIKRGTICVKVPSLGIRGELRNSEHDQERQLDSKRPFEVHNRKASETYELAK